MKNIWHKLDIHLTTYFFFLVSFLSGYFKNILIIFLIIILHELGHVLTILLCHYRIIKVEIYPFGGITKIDKPLNSSINKEILIAISGLIMQIILSLVINNELFNFYNKTIFYFNLIPIYPLDGSIIIRSLLEKILPFEKSLLIYQITSYFCLLIFIIFNILYLHNYFICLVLLIQLIYLKKQAKYIINRFYLERFLYSYPYHKIRNEIGNNYHLLRKNTRHYFYYQNRYWHEREVLASNLFVE